MATIIPRNSTGLEPFKCNVRFDMKRTKSLLSENIQHTFGKMVYITYPGPVAVTDTNGEPLHFIGEMTFRIVIEGESTVMSAWVTNDIEPGQLILGSDVPEDLGLQLYNIPDTSSPSGHAEDTTTIKDPRGSAPVTRSAKHRVPAHKISYLNNHPSDAFLTPFQYGFRREVVRSTNGKTLTIYYYTEDGIRLRCKKDVGPHIRYLQGITKDDFNFLGVILPLDDPTNEYQSVRPASTNRRSIPQITHRESYQTTDDSAHSAEEAREHQKTSQRWGQDTSWGQPEDTYTRQDFDPGPYDTEVLRHKDRDWRSKKPILPSSDETGEDVPHETRHVAYRDTIESRRLADIQRQNKMLLSDMEREDIKQDPDNYIKKEPDGYVQLPQRHQHQREPPPRELQQRVDAQWSNTYEHTAAPTSRLNGNRQAPTSEQFDNHHRQLSTHHLKRETQREYGGWN